MALSQELSFIYVDPVELVQRGTSNLSLCRRFQVFGTREVTKREQCRLELFITVRSRNDGYLVRSDIVSQREAAVPRQL